jgi:tight adherence protein B
MRWMAWPTARARWRRLLYEASAPRRDPLVRLRAVLPGARRATAGLVAACCVVVGLLLGGPMAGAVLAIYGALGAALALRRARRRAEESSAKAAMDAVAGLAAELRAGVHVPTALAAAAHALHGPSVVGTSAATVARRVRSAVEAAESSGAPLADVLERLDAHLRAIDRARASVSAQVAGARASAFLLAAMPVAGVALGFVIGVDSLHVLLSTPLGAACIGGSVALQLGGLAWAGRLSRVEVYA